MRTRQLLAQLVSLLAVGLLGLATIVGCGGGGGGDEAETAAWIRIDVPADSTTTSLDSVTVSGNAAERDGGYPSGSVYWYNQSNGISGVARSSVTCIVACLVSWEADIPLRIGPNVLSVTFIDATASITVTRTATALLSGRITMDSDARSVGDIVVQATPGDREALTDVTGFYRIEGLVAGTYTVTPQAPEPPQSGDCLAFTPSSREVAMDGTTDVSGQDFIATPISPCFVVSGRVTASTNPDFGQAGIQMKITDAQGAAHTRITDASGNYAFLYLAPGTYTVTPSYCFVPLLPGDCATFTPPSRTVTIENADVPAQDFLRNF